MTASCRGSLIVLAALPLGLVGCSDARLVRTDAYGGTVAITRNTNVWPSYERSAAEEMMKQKCPGGYVIDSEREVVVRQEVDPGSHGWVTHPVTEYQITFHDKNAPVSTQPAIVPVSATVPAKPPAPVSTLPPQPVPVVAQ
jgi:hypothetical protein